MNKVDSFPQPLADPRLEAAAQILNKSMLSTDDIEYCQMLVEAEPTHFLAMLAEARKQTGADEVEKRADNLLAAINYALKHEADGLIWLRDWHNGEPDALAELDAALAKYEGVG
jgi:hypothetical protein